MKAADMHCDTISEIFAKRKAGNAAALMENECHIDLIKLKKGDALLQNFALFVDADRTENPLEEVLFLADLYYEELEKNKEIIAPVFCREDIENNCKAGKISALLTVEEGAVCKGQAAFLRTLYRIGVRMLTLTWNYPNEIGYPNVNSRRIREEEDSILFLKKADTQNGLTQKGRELIEEMERIGMIVDVSHLSDAGFYDVLACTKKPFAASHSNARSLCPWVRNMTDDMIRKTAQRGGVIGLNFCPDFLEEKPIGVQNNGTIAAVVRHARHMADVGGIECVGLGSDFDGIPTHAQLYDYSCLPMLAEALLQSGFSFGEVEKIFYKNVLRLYSELL